MSDKLRNPVRCLAVIFLVMVAFSLNAQMSEDWADSPEAYFLTSREHAEWAVLRSDAARNAFKERYWLRRDPTPATAVNEFRDAILVRIKTANERFKIGDTEGARTARGLAFVVFGSPSRINETPIDRPGGRSSASSGEVFETMVVWKYERDRNPKLLKLLDRPHLEFTFYLEPERKRDRFEVEQQARDLQQIVAERSIVNPDVRQAPPAAEVPSKFIPIASPSGELSADALAGLRSDRTDARVRFGYASLVAAPQITAWFFVPDELGVTNPKIVARLLDEKNAEVERISVDAQATDELFSSQKGRTFGVSLRIPAPGSYHAEFALLDGSRPVATGKIPRVALAPADAAGLQISSVVVSGGFRPVTSREAAFAWGDVQITPRSDDTFGFNESLWYFVQVAHPSSPEGLVTELRLRKDNVPYGKPMRVAAEAGQIGPALYMIGRELPLLALEPGNYSLYLTVIDGADEKVARADFKVLGP